MPARTRGLIVGVLLAAGAGSRFGGGKLVARLADGRGVAETACAHLLPAVVVALGGELAGTPAETDAVSAELPRPQADKPVAQAATADDPPF